MKATLWLCTLLTTLLCVSRQVSGGPYTDTRILQPQDNSLVAPAKRTKASLSIVNPLDVLRQRIILEMARRRMQENSMQVARNQAILREIGKRSRDDFPQDVNPLHFGAPDRFYYEKLPFLRRYDSSHPPRPMMVEYDVGPAEGRKSAGTSSNSRSSSRDSNDIPASTTISEAGKQINDRKEISSNGGSGSSSSGQSGGDGLTLAAEQRQLEREQQREAQQEANKMLHSAVAIVGPQEMRFSNERVMLPNGMVGGNPRDSRDDDGGNDEDDDADAESVGDEDEYFQGSNFPSGRREQKLPKDDERLNSDDYRLRYLYRIQGKYFG
ncbi:uncharacterized protein LOC109430363 [Aedes albopictus]|uniref:Corticotropin-releasing factor domain-containing protein n=1 Tax=Aedes albopictus TaxID=7160 RepID=A0ABM1ZI74_AEDAL